MHGLALVVPPEFSHPEKAAKPHQYARARANATKHAREALETIKGNQASCQFGPGSKRIPTLPAQGCLL